MVATNVVAVDTIVCVVLMTTICSGGVVVGRSVRGGRMCAGAGGRADVDMGCGLVMGNGVDGAWPGAIARGMVVTMAVGCNVGVFGKAGIVVGVRVDSLVGDFVTST